MAVQTVQTTGDIPAALEPFYIGSGTPGTEGYQPGLIELGTQAIFPDKLSGIDAYKEIYAPLIEAELTGAGAVAPMSEGQKTLGERIAGLAIPGQFQTATEAGEEAATGFQSLQDLQALGVTADDLIKYQLGPTRQFTAAERQTYMDPYMQGVVDIQQRRAIEDAQRAQLGQNLAAARQGTYGGARQALLQGQRESGLRQQLGDIQATGLQSAFQQAQQQFERDRAAEMGTARANLEALLGVQQLGAGQSLEAQRANQQAALQAAQQRLGAAQGLTGLAQTLGGLGTQRLAGELDITKTLGAYGDLERAIEQQKLDARRQDLLQQAEYGQTQVGQLSNLLRGIPMTDTTQTVTTPPPSFASQLTGLGLTGIGLYNLLGGG